MHELLRQVMDKSVEYFRNDPRVLAGYHTGSVNGPNEDPLSDVDPLFWIKGEEYDNFDRDLRKNFSSFCPNIVLWWPERGNGPKWKNYAIIFKSEGLWLQYDINFIKHESEKDVPVLKEQFFFDKIGITKVMEPSLPYAKYSPERLLWHIESYWLYVYIMVKYAKRSAIFKMLYTQNFFFEAHVEILHALHPDVEWGWWPMPIKQYLSHEKQDFLLNYWGANTRDSILDKVKIEIEEFRKDAMAACELHGIPYCHEFEKAVREHLHDGFPERF